MSLVSLCCTSSLFNTYKPIYLPAFKSSHVISIKNFVFTELFMSIFILEQSEKASKYYHCGSCCFSSIKKLFNLLLT